MMDNELAEKLQETTEWMVERLSLTDKIEFIAPVKIEIDDNHTIWTLTFGGHRVTSSELKEAVDVAVRCVCKDVDRDVIATCAAALTRQPGDAEKG
jgi:hypothetical protein